MIARAFSQTTPAARAMRVAGQQVRHSSGLPIPPKIATPKSVGGSGASNTDAVVSFYKALPKGPEPEKRSMGIKANYFDGKNASGKPLVATIAVLMLIGYTIEYNGHLSMLTVYADHRAPQERAPLGVDYLANASVLTAEMREGRRMPEDKGRENGLVVMVRFVLQWCCIAVRRGCAMLLCDAARCCSMLL